MLLSQFSFGASRVLGDFNGDGFKDLAIGVRGEDSGGISDVGAVNVLYGSAAGLQATGVGGPEDQIWDQNTAGVQGTSETDDQFGNALTVGDFNGDGNDDLAIGVHHEDLGGIRDAGAVNVLYGSATGLQATGAGGPDDQLWHQDSAGVVGTAESGDGFGDTLAAGDFNFDGIDDLAIGVVGENVRTIRDGGAINVLYGSFAGLQATGLQAPDDQEWHQDSPGVQGTAESDDHFSEALSAGDFNGDRIDDLAIGVANEDVGSLSSAGAVNVLYGSETGLQATGAGGPDDQLWHQDSTGVQGVAGSNEFFGDSLSAGDFNHDSVDDLAIGAWGDEFGSLIQPGAVNVLYGSNTGLQATGAGGPDDQLWNQDSVGVQGVAEHYDFFGRGLSSGDFNGDAFDDLAIGAPGQEVGDMHAAGAVGVLHGSGTGLQATGAGGPDDQLWDQDSPGVQGTAGDEDGLGDFLATGDFNGDDNDDLAMGVPGENVLGVLDSGAVNVLYGSETGLQATGVRAPDDQFWHQNSAEVKGQNEECDTFGVLPQSHRVLSPICLVSFPGASGVRSPGASTGRRQ
jgi:hypothetical protein